MTQRNPWRRLIAMAAIAVFWLLVLAAAGVWMLHRLL
jgi:hypothetical protein